MIERAEIDGRMATVCYVDAEGSPCPKRDARRVRIVWDDGDSAWAEVADETQSVTKS